MTSSVLAPSLSKRKCCDLSLLNRAPEASLESTLLLLRRDHARFTLNAKIAESKLWDELYRNERDLKASLVSKYSFEEALERRDIFRLPRDSEHIERHELPFSEGYKQFVMFRAKTMFEMYGPGGSPYSKRPNYKRMYANNANARRRNQQSLEKIRRKYKEQQHADNKVLEVLNGSQSENQPPNSSLRRQSRCSASSRLATPATNRMHSPAVNQTSRDITATNRLFSPPERLKSRGSSQHGSIRSYVTRKDGITLKISRENSSVTDKDSFINVKQIVKGQRRAQTLLPSNSVSGYKQVIRNKRLEVSIDPVHTEITTNIIVSSEKGSFLPEIQSQTITISKTML